MSDNTDKMTIEEAFSALEDTIAKLETADITLEDSFSAYQEGIPLIKYCNQIVTDVEQKVMILEENGHEHEF